MKDYKEAFNRGLDAARAAERARNEIDEVLSEFFGQVKGLSDGKVEIRVFTYEKSDSGFLPMLTFPPKPKETYDAIVAKSALREKPVFQLAKWKPSPAGYPCKLTWGGGDLYCEDKEALERCLGEILADPLIGEKLLSLMAMEAPPEEAQEEAQQDGADQPATAVESMSEGDDKAEPEAEERSQ
ncbi:MAG: hypothetical protein R3F19_27160 [Verrucomicrobiales bacterium]